MSQNLWALYASPHGPVLNPLPHLQSIVDELKVESEAQGGRAPVATSLAWSADGQTLFAGYVSALSISSGSRLTSRALLQLLGQRYPRVLGCGVIVLVVMKRDVVFSASDLLGLTEPLLRPPRSNVVRLCSFAPRLSLDSLNLPRRNCGAEPTFAEHWLSRSICSSERDHEVSFKLRPRVAEPRCICLS